MDMSLYYEAWPGDWTNELDECLGSAGKVGMFAPMIASILLPYKATTLDSTPPIGGVYGGDGGL
jgi:hypothetical protein